MEIDVHQHLLSEPLIGELSRRRQAPMVTRLGGGWSLRVPNEPDSTLPLAATDVAVRGEELRRDGVDRALVALSTALGIETLPVAEAEPLLAAHHQGARDLPAGFGGWGAVQLQDPEPAEVDAVIALGCAGLSLPAGALAGPAALERVGPLLERLEAHDAPLFVHPGPVVLAGGAEAVASLPAWWPALTDYVAQMQAAWLAFLHAGRRHHPRLRVLFAMQAGGAPLQLERLGARGGNVPLAPDPLVFYDTSSYGPRMLAAMAEAVGLEQLVYGSDRPVVDPAPPPLGPELSRLVRSANPNRLLTPRQKGDRR
jgi:6-methylsalicylate decarboxylase